MPEGDTLFRIAAGLAPALTGQPVLALVLPKSSQRVAHLVGHRIERVEARGKNLLVFFDEGSVLHTHLRMSGLWHLYRTEDPWRRPPEQATAVIEVPGYLAVCFRAPVTRLLRQSDLARDPQLAALGPDLLGETFDLDEALRRIQEQPDTPLGVAIMDQRAVAGIGNVYKSELLFRQRLDPFAPVRCYPEEELRALLDLARAILVANVQMPSGPWRYESPGQFYRYTRTTREGRVPGRKATMYIQPLGGGRRAGALAVYRRARQACYDCGTLIRMKRQGEAQRSTYFCPQCQPSRREA
ncbi:Fpg/Nei family DNA glycosylase [Chondromyces crocatus]|uniref:DNA-(apurinic or apyrimidinic site) lyase n=1 Tax=Chondromyces crocatus TaxID=52 RepID=A0A0K1EA65_CHOCO|nr:DNA-formamidopyrimidine glycosylase family protein [Chondromyces crocatus]AKT37744.1 DNA glycosylase [Chondromyces crocatus]